ncbi:uncharacterized protein LOC135369745 [Ornithodoros turicata]|uniref:uncharacterized protein LOC135369745 n=1 Tax=Ornithodoros turicata TaxID=34597 RepID=UPI003138DB9D
MAESQFALAGITQRATKFHHVVSNLPPEIAVEVMYVFTTPLSTAPYGILRKAITDRTMASEREHLRQLSAAEELGARRPSQLLRLMNRLLGTRLRTFDNVLLKELFLTRLPPQARMVLAALPNTTLEALADVADKVLAVAQPTIAHSSPAPSLTLASELVPLNTNAKPPPIRIPTAYLFSDRKFWN